MDRKKIKNFFTQYIITKGATENFILNIIVVGKNKMKLISKKYKQENQALPVLSFLYNKDIPPVGEVLVCYPLAILLAAERNKKVDDTIISLIKHGVDNLIRN